MKNVLFITLPFKSHYFPAFNLAHTYHSHGYDIYFTGLSNSESIITNQGFNFIPLNYITQNEIKDLKNLFGFFLKSISDQRFVKDKYEDFLMEGNSLISAINKTNPIKVLLEINIAEYYLFFKNLNIDTELFSIYLPTRRRRGIPPLDSSYTPNGSLFSDFICFFLWKIYLLKKYINRKVNNFAFWKCNDDYFFDRFCKKNKVQNILSSDFFHSKGIISLKNNILCSEKLEFPNFKAFPNEVFHQSLKNRKESVSISKEDIFFLNILKEKKSQGKKLILMSFGTFAYGNKKVDAFIEKAITVINEIENVILVISHIGNFNYKNSDKLFVFKWLPQMEVLQNASLMITHGGLGTYKECVEADIKMLVAPVNLVLDQVGNAKRIEKNGFGNHIKLNINNHKLKALIKKSLE